jgi:hypothetical protein
MPIFKYRIQITGVFSKKGFGFSCMHLAYDNNITGSLFYESANSVILEITGNESDILNTIEKCKKEEFINEIHILNKTLTRNKLTDFIMLNQID